MNLKLQEKLVSNFSYLNLKLEIQTTGMNRKLVAGSKIEKGEVVAVWGGKAVHKDELSATSGYALQISSDFYLINPVENGELDSIQYISISKEPNCAFDGEITLKALEEIQAGEEISFDPFGERIKTVTKFEDNAWGLLTSLDIESCDAATIRDAAEIKRYVIELCELIEMKRFGECHVVHFGEDERVAGYSMLQLIETSCISGHFANDTNTSYIDIFSCKAYDPQVVEEFTRNFFKGGKTRTTVTNRY